MSKRAKRAPEYRYIVIARYLGKEAMMKGVWEEEIEAEASITYMMATQGIEPGVKFCVGKIVLVSEWKEA